MVTVFCNSILFSGVSFQNGNFNNKKDKWFSVTQGW